MKKLLVFAVFAGGLAAFTACKKDHTCTCTTVTTGLIGSTSTADTVFTDMTKSDAKSKCTGLNTSGSAFGQTWDVSCELK